jgi:integrase
MRWYGDSVEGFIRPPKVSRLPDIVSVAEAQTLFGATRVLSCRVFFFTLYSLGLRLGDGLTLTVGDIDGERMRVHVRDAKGNRDRLVPLPEQTLHVLRGYWRVHQHPRLLFPNRAGGLRGGVQRTLHQVAAGCGLKRTSRHTACDTAMQPT